MKASVHIAPLIKTSLWFLSVSIVSSMLLLACAKDESKSFNSQNTLVNKIFILGSQIDIDGNLILYVNGTAVNGEPLTDVELQNSSVTVTTATESTNYINGDSVLTIQPVNSAGDKILSLSLITDYSGSIDDSALNAIGDVFKTILTYLPLVYEAQIINFSDNYHVEIGWTEASENYDAIVAATYRDDTIKRNGTALYDTIGFTLMGDPSIVGTPTTQGDGLIERCRPAHMMMVFSDGLNNPQPNSPNTYADIIELTDLIENSESIVIMLGTSNADLATLQAFAGSRGAVVQMDKPENIKSEIDKWAQSLSYMAKFTLSADSQFSGNTVTISLGSQEVIVAHPTDTICRIEL